MEVVAVVENALNREEEEEKPKTKNRNKKLHFYCGDFSCLYRFSSNWSRYRYRIS